DTQILARCEKECRDARAEGEREAQVVEICERNIAKDPGARVVAAFAHYCDLVFVTVHPTNEPAREVKKDPESGTPIADRACHIRWSVKVRQFEQCREDVAR